MQRTQRTHLPHYSRFITSNVYHGLWKEGCHFAQQRSEHAVRFVLGVAIQLGARGVLRVAKHGAIPREREEAL